MEMNTIAARPFFVVRAEANWMQFGGVTLTSQNNSDNSVTADDIDGFGARISVGKSF